MARIKKVIFNTESPFTRSQLNEEPEPSDTNSLKVKVETITGDIGGR